MRRYVVWAVNLLALALWLAVPASAAPATGDFRKWLETVWPEAQKIGVSRATFDAATGKLQPDLSLPDLEGYTSKSAEKAQAEFIRPAGGYMDEKYIGALSAAGSQQAARYRDLLPRIEKTYGVPGSILLAIFGRETDFGGEHPKKSVVQVIATEAFAGRRKQYFREQFIWALKMLEDGDVAPADFTGSWAGAFGLTQFMPTGFRDYAVDFDGDGKRDVWNSVADALATSAVELTKSIDRDGTPVGWQRGKTWGYEVRKPRGLDCTLGGYDRPKSVKDWQKLGFARAYGKAFRPDELDDPAFLLLPEGAAGPAFLVFNNFLSLKVYNYADLYALFVGHTADRIAGGPPFEAKWAEASHLSEASVFDLQRKLVTLGYDVGKVDGKIGWKMRIALGDFEKKQKLPVLCYPSEADGRVLGKVAVGTQ